MTGPDWRSIAVRVAVAEGQFYLLSTAERDALEDAQHDYYEAERERAHARLGDVVRLHAVPPEPLPVVALEVVDAAILWFRHHGVTPPPSYDEIGAVLGLDGPRVRQRLNVVVQRLRAACAIARRDST